MTHRVTLIPGDGVGPELTEATRRVLEATGVGFDWDVQEAGAGAMDAYGTPLPENVLESIRTNRVAIKGPITTPVGGGFRSVNVALRKELDLFCCLRPCKSYPGVRSRYQDVDVVIVRENTEDLYAGIEFEQGSGSSPTWRGSGSARTRASRSSRSACPAPSGSSATRSSTRGSTVGARSRPCTRPTS